MKKALVCGLTFLAALALAPSPVSAADARSATPEPDAAIAAPATEGAPADAPVVLFLTREEHAKALARQPLARPVKSPLMTFHGGTIMTSSKTMALYWGTGWADNAFVGDKITGLDAFYSGFGGSHYAGTSAEYTGTNGQVSTASQYLGHFVDTSAGPTHAPRTSAVLAEVCKMVPNPDPDGFYAVYTDLPRGHAGYCAWHSWGSCGDVPVQFSFYFDLDGDAGCDPADGSGLHSQGLAALANVTAHELSEAMTDPQGQGWFDSSGAENGDKCAWTFNVPLVTFSDNNQWKVQGEWSNAAYTAGTGYPNRSGQYGCLDGH
jgi:hypothetical protein